MAGKGETPYLHMARDGWVRPGNKWAAAMKPNKLKATSDTIFQRTRNSMSTAQKFPTNLKFLKITSD